LEEEHFQLPTPRAWMVYLRMLGMVIRDEPLALWSPPPQRGGWSMIGQLPEQGTLGLEL
jgi:hypothetical protein